MTARAGRPRTLRPCAIVAAVCALSVAACARYNPHPPQDVPFLERAQTQERDGLRVTASVLSADEAKHVFGTNLVENGMQPVWLDIENNTSQYFGLLLSGVDPNYFSTHEAAYISHYAGWRFAGSANKRMDEHFRRYGLYPEVDPGQRQSGFVFTNLKIGAKEVRARLYGPKRVEEFTFYIQVPSGLQFDYERVNWDALYKPDEIVDYETEAEFRQALAMLPCCTAKKDGTGEGDPVNLIVVGNGEDVAKAFVRAGWDVTEVLSFGSAWETFKRFFGGEYKTSPMSALYMYGRAQDVGLQKARGTIHQRNHLRLWLSPMRFRGRDVWVGTITRDIGVYFTTRAWNLTTHAIDPDVDEARGYVSEDLALAQSLERFGFVRGVGSAEPDAPHRNTMNAPWWTDGLRLVMVVSPTQDVALEEIDLFDWDWEPVKERAARGAKAPAAAAAPRTTGTATGAGGKPPRPTDL